MQADRIYFCRYEYFRKNQTAFLVNAVKIFIAARHCHKKYLKKKKKKSFDNAVITVMGK